MPSLSHWTPSLRTYPPLPPSFSRLLFFVTLPSLTRIAMHTVALSHEFVADELRGDEEHKQGEEEGQVGGRPPVRLLPSSRRMLTPFAARVSREVKGEHVEGKGSESTTRWTFATRVLVYARATRACSLVGQRSRRLEVALRDWLPSCNRCEGRNEARSFVSPSHPASLQS